MFQKIRNNIPNAITCMNLLFGVLAIIAATQGSHGVVFRGHYCGTGYQLAFLCMALAAVMDFLDGLVARAIHAVSPLGAQLDSLSDLVSFGVAPALTMFFLLRERPDISWIAGAAMLLVPLAGAVRLARFNIDTTQTTTFKGLPIPANAIFWIGFAAWFAAGTCAYPAAQWIVIAAAVLLSWLMVCNQRIFSLKLHSLSPSVAWPQYLLLLCSVVLLIVMGLPGLAVAIVLYVLLSLVVCRGGTDVEKNQQETK